MPNAIGRQYLYTVKVEVGRNFTVPAADQAEAIAKARFLFTQYLTNDFIGELPLSFSNHIVTVIQSIRCSKCGYDGTDTTDNYRFCDDCWKAKVSYPKGLSDE